MLGRNGRVVLVALAVVFGSTAPAAAVDHGFSLVSGTIFSTPLPGTGGGVRLLSGNVSPFGNVGGVLIFNGPPAADGTYSATISLADRQPDGTLSTTNTISGQVNGQFANATQYAELVTITGGTGAYQGIRGLVVLGGQLDAQGNGTDRVITGFVFIPW